MKSLKHLTNQITNRLTLINSADTGLQQGPPSTTTNNVIGTQNTIDKELGDLTDRRRINRTIQNARECLEIDPTTWSSIISMVIVANNNFKITADEDTNPDAVQHIKDKSKSSDWDLDALMTETLIKGMVDSKCFIRTWPNPENTNTLDVDMLAYDDKAYNFLELQDQQTGEIIGYKQKATIYPVPSDWENTEFDKLASRDPEEVEANFTPEQIIHPKFLERDNKADSLVFKVLDYVDIKREIENMIPAAVRRASLTLGVEIGNRDVDLNVNNETQAQAMVDDSADTFKEKEKKDVISHFYGVRPYMIGDGKIPDIIGILGYLKQEIRQALLTPDSRFESESSNRAVAQEQLSGSMGQSTTIEYLRSWLIKYFEDILFNRELMLKYPSEVGKVHISFDSLELEDDETQARIASILEASFPSLNQAERDLRINTYFEEYAHELKKNPQIQKELEGIEPTNPKQNPLNEPGILQNSLPYADMVEYGRRVLVKEGVIS